MCLLTGHNSYCGLMIATRVHISYCQKLACQGGSVCIKCKHFQHQERVNIQDLHGFVSLSDFVTEEEPLGLFINIETRAKVNSLRVQFSLRLLLMSYFCDYNY